MLAGIGGEPPPSIVIKIVAIVSLIGCVKNIPFISKKIGKTNINGTKNTTCLNTVIKIESMGRLMD